MLKDKIRTQRKGLAMSQEELAEALGVSRQTIYKWESGQALPDIANVKSLCKALHMTCDELLEDEQEIKPDQINYIKEGSKLVKKHWRKLGYVLLYWGIPAFLMGLLMKAAFPYDHEVLLMEGPIRMLWLIPMLALICGAGATFAGIFLLWKDHKINSRKKTNTN